MSRRDGIISGAGRWLAVSVIIILVTGSALTLWTAGQADQNMRDQLLIKTRLAAAGINALQVAALNGSAADLGTPDYLALKRQMAAIRLSDPDIRFTYLIGQKPDGTFFIFGDSEPPDSPDYSPPGQSYPEVPAQIVSGYMTGRDLTEGPYSDRWGTWISGIVPVNEPADGGRIAVFGMDVDARDRNRQIILACLPPITGSLLVLVLILIFFFIQQRNERERRWLDASGQALRESEEKYRTILDNTGSATIIIEKDTTISFTNPEFERITGYSKEEIEGRKSWTELVVPEDADKMKRNSMLRRTDPDTAPKNYEFRFITKDGQIRNAYISIGIIPGTQQSVASFVDITERKQAEEALKESEARLNSIVHGSPMLQFVIDKKHQVISWNKAIEECSGVKEAEVLGTRDQWKAFYESERPVLADLLVDEKIELLPEWYQGTITKSRLVDGAYEATDFFPKMGTSGKWLYFTAAPIRDAKGTIIGSVETLEDITERKLAEVALNQAFRKINLLSSITRHDINNQLTVILGYVDMLESKQLDPTLSEYFHTIATAAQRISSMIQFTREYEQIGVNAPVWQDCRTVVDTAAKQAPHGKVMVINDLPAGMEVFADQLVGKVCYNLMDNAARHGGKITTIRFFVEGRDGDHLIICEDDGDGVVAEEKERIFDRGFGKNTGLGLALSREILAITGITIRETGIPGMGARFEMTVPKGAYRFT